jgi:glycosyl transferase family 25
MVQLNNSCPAVMQVFVINLASATDRLAYMSDQLGGAFERIDAVGGHAVPARLAVNFSGAMPLLPGEIGCYASHLMAAETILARGLPYAIVLEDDAELASDFHDVVETCVGRLPAGWDIVGLSDVKHCLHHRLLQLSSDRSLVRYAHFPKTTTAYVLSQSGCRKLLASRQRTRPIDVDIRYGWEMGLNGYGVLPPPAGPSEKFESSIPKSTRRRFYWRADPLGYLKGRIKGVRKLGLANAARAYLAGSSSTVPDRQQRS